MDILIDFFSFSNPNVRWVVLGSLIICASSAVVGCFAYINKKSLIGDAVSHAVLPGICLAFMFSQTKNLLFLLIGAFISGWLAIFVIDYITHKSKIKTDAATGLVLSVFYGVGILLLTSIQSTGNASQSGLDQFLFGKTASLVYDDVIIFFLTGIFLIFTIILFFKPFRMVAFDKDFARSNGFPVKGLEILSSTLTVIAIAIGIQAVGVVLMLALLVTPAAAARYWTHALSKMLFIAAFFGAFAGLFGSFISYTVPNMPTGPWIVSILSLIAFVSVFLGSKKGVAYRYFSK